MRLYHLLTLLLAGIAATAPARAAGMVEIVFVEPERFADVGRGEIEIERSLKDLEAIFQALAQRLPDGQHLSLQVTQVDLAGELQLSRRGQEVRVLRGRADWPRMELSYTLTRDGRALRSGRSELADMNYLQRLPRPSPDEALAHERRMIERWFTDTILSPAADPAAPPRGTP